MATPRRPAKSNTRYFLRFAGTATLLVSGTLVLVLYVLPQRYVLSSGFREGALALPTPSVPFEPADPLIVAALPPIPPPTEVVRGPAELFWERVLPLLEQGRYDDAIPLFAAYLAEYPGDLGVRREYGVTFARGGYGPRAITVFEGLLTVEDDRELRLLLARTYRDIGDVDRAAIHYRTVVEASPTDEAIVLEWARAHMAVEQYGRAEAILLDGLAAIPGSIEIRADLARIYYYTGRLPAAETVLVSMSDDELSATGTLQLRTDVLEALAPIPGPDPEPPPPPTLLEQAVAAREAGELDRARSLFEAAIAASPDEAEAWQAFADFLQYELGDFDGALVALREVERVTGGGDATLQYRMAQLEIWTDRTGDAATRLEGLLGTLARPEAADGTSVTRADVLALLGELHRWEGERLAAVRRYEEALVVDPRHLRAREGLALIRADVDRRMVEAEEPRLGAIAESLADTDDYLRLDLGGEWYGLSEDWVWGTRTGARFVEGVELDGASGDARGAFAELEGARWWRWGTIRTALHLGVQTVRSGEVDVSAGASARFVGGTGARTDVRLEHAPAFGITNTLQSVRADVRQDRLYAAHARPLGEEWSLALSGEAASLAHGGVVSAERNLRVSFGASAGRLVSRSVTLGLATRGLRYMDPSPQIGVGSLYWDPSASVSVGPYAQLDRALGTWWTLSARVNPGVALLDERRVEGTELVPDLAGNLTLRREGARYLTRVELFYGQGRFTGYRSFGLNLGFSARGWFGRADQDIER